MSQSPGYYDKVISNGGGIDWVIVVVIILDLMGMVMD